MLVVHPIAPKNIILNQFGPINRQFNKKINFLLHVKIDMYILYKRVTSPHVDRNGPFFKGKTDTTGSVDIIILELGNN